jgi:hypothetical protein
MLKLIVSAAPHITKVAKAVTAVASAIAASAIAYVKVREAADYSSSSKSRR